jgi:hypothetical protein
MAYIHSIGGASIPFGFFDDDNIGFIQQKIINVLKNEYVQEIRVDRASIVRVMQRVLEERPETIPKMNQRVVMYICAEFRNEQYEANKNLKYEAHYVESQRLFDPTTLRGASNKQEVKTRTSIKYPDSQVGSTLRFYFIA